jgi:AraC-like DNA-binding protein
MQPDADVRLTEIDRRFLEEVRRYVAQHIDSQELSVDMLCRLLHMSRTSFYNKLKALTGCSPADFIRSERLSRAAELLKDGSRSVTEVAEMAGFNDAKYFREVFKKHFGMPPAQYGKRHK